jgi:cell division protein ZapA
MSRAPVELRVGGQTYRVVASAGEDELKRLAELVDGRLRELAGPGRAIAPQSLLLAAISLAHDLEEERGRREAVEARSREMLRSVLRRIDDALEVLPDGDDGSPDAVSPEL